MNNYYTLRYLVADLKSILTGSIFVSAGTPGKSEITLLFENSNETLLLKVSVVPGRQSIFSDFPGKSNKSARIDFFSELGGQMVTGMDLADSDRQIRIRFGIEKYLLIQLYGSAGNVFLIENGVIKETFKNPDKLKGKPAPVPRPPQKQKAEPSGEFYKDLILLNPLLPRTFLKELPVVRKWNSYTVQNLLETCSELEKVLLSRLEPGLNPDGRFNPWPSDIFDVPGKEVFESVNKAIRTSYYSLRKKERFSRSFDHLLKLLSRQKDRYIKRLDSLDQIVKTRERIEKNEQAGHLLMANLHVKPESSDLVTVPNFYGSGEVIIKIKPGLSMAENAALYYDKAKKGKRSLEVAGENRDEVKNKLIKCDQLLNSLHIEGRSGDSDRIVNWVSEHSELLDYLNLNEDELKGKTFPFRRIHIHGYDIWIGKNATNNDELLRAAHKEDVWMHARDVSGSHVLIRMNRSQGFPEPAILEKAAGIAAWYSRAKTVGLAPVVYAKRKHVRKPKGAAPGIALVDKEQVLLVKPEPLEKKYQ
jgi:predicted ribosome quality control (RQC) complex YloA/Tae2 family protein